MMIVNRHFAATPLDPFGGLADVDGEYEKYLSIDMNDEAAVKAQIIRPVILPYVRRLDDLSLARVKLALAYVLSDPKSRFDRVFYSTLPPFEAPANPRDFFVWIWDECFPGESHEIDIDACELHDELEEPTWTLKFKPEQ